jgi:hypothetical protein
MHPLVAEATMQRLTLLTVFTAALATGCAARVGYRASVSGADYGPDLVYVAPGVQVIADYDQPIFYADNFYWRYDGRSWYRSSVYTGGWVYASPPPVIVRIERPHAYVHYRPAGWAPSRARQRPDTRDHRQARPGKGHKR